MESKSDSMYTQTELCPQSRRELAQWLRGLIYGAADLPMPHLHYIPVPRTSDAEILALRAFHLSVTSAMQTLETQLRQIEQHKRL